jgi:hypothetical protein
LESEDVESLVYRREWPCLERRYLGDVVRNYWAGEIASAAGLVVAVRNAVMDLGVGLGDDDELVDLGLEGLMVQPDAEAHGCR